VLWETSRGGRELEEWSHFLNVCRARGILIHVTSQDKTYDMARGGDWKSLAIDGVTAADESDKRSLQVRRALSANAAGGRPHGGPVLWGYERTYDAGTGRGTGLRLNPETMPYPREVITRVAAGEPVHSIARDMQRRGVPAPQGGQWNTALVRRIALNRAYAGQRWSDGEWIDAIWPPVTDVATARDARTVLEGRRGRHGTGPGGLRHLLSYLALCGQCGGVLMVSARRPSGHRLYTCARRGCVAVREDWLDAWVTGLVCGRLDRPEFWEAVLRGGDSAVQAARAEAADLRERLEEHIDAASRGALSADSLGRLERILRPQIDAADKRAESIAVPTVLRGLRRKGTDMRTIFEAEPVAVRKAVVRELFESITLHRSPHRGRNTGFDPSRVTVEWRDL
jgi:site-specific DNA recombinase